MIEILGVREMSEVPKEELRKIMEAQNKSRRAVRRADPQERTRAAVYATGNRWAIENFEATHSH